MIQAALSLAIAAVVLSAAAVLVSVGTAIRLTTERPSSQVFSSRTNLLPTHWARAVEATASHGFLAGPSLVIVGASQCPGCEVLVGQLADRELEAFEGRVLIVDEGAANLETSGLRAAGPEGLFYMADKGSLAMAELGISVLPTVFTVLTGRPDQIWEGAECRAYTAGVPAPFEAYTLNISA